MVLTIKRLTIKCTASGWTLAVPIHSLRVHLTQFRVRYIQFRFRYMISASFRYEHQKRAVRPPVHGLRGARLTQIP